VADLPDDIILRPRTSVLALAGNIVDEHPYGPWGQEIRKGTRLFRPGTKIYLSGLDNWGVLSRPPTPLDSVRVIGQQRQSRQWIECWVRTLYVTNWRIQVVYKPGAVQRLREADWPGFWFREGEFILDDKEDRTSPEAIEEFLDIVDDRYREEWQKREELTQRTGLDLRGCVWEEAWERL
jgi:hypothetical protein